MNKGFIIFCIGLLIVGVIIFLVKKNEKKKPSKEDPKVVGTGSIRISCIGDSITYGYGVKKEREYAWPSLLVKELGNDYKTYNYGITRRTLLKEGEYPFDEEPLAKEFWKRKEDIIIMMLGTNDTKGINWNKELFEKEYLEMVQRLKNKKGNPEVYVVIPPYIFETEITEERPNNEILTKEVIPIIEDVGEKENVTVINTYEITKSHPEWFPDALHPNKEGNEAIAKEIAKGVKRNQKL